MPQVSSGKRETEQRVAQVRLTHPDRVLYPLRRSGPKGSRQFTRISWDEAVAEITSRWKDIIAKYGSQAIMPYSYLGNEGLVQGLTAGDAFFNKLGQSISEAEAPRIVIASATHRIGGTSFHLAPCQQVCSS